MPPVPESTAPLSVGSNAMNAGPVRPPCEWPKKKTLVRIERDRAAVPSSNDMPSASRMLRPRVGGALQRVVAAGDGL